MFDVIVVGASLSGCTAATFLGRAGLKVALLEKESHPTAFKKVCTHFIQPSATPTLQRLGVVEAIEAAGGVRNSMDMYTRFGWVEHPLHEHGYSIRRETLDPILRSAAAQTPGVELRTGSPVTGLVREGGRVAGVIVQQDGKAPATLRARLVVGADGRHSKVGQLARAEAKKTANNRFMYWAYYRGLRLPRGPQRSLYWLLDPDAAYCFPNEDGIVLVAAQPHKDKLAAFRNDVEGSFLRYFDAVPDAPRLREGERLGEIRGMLDMPNHTRPAFQPGLAFVGDAALTSDPLFGVGCGWALQSGEWLADTLAGPLLARRGIDEALAAYGELHTQRLHPHHNLINMASQGARFNPVEKLLFKAASRDRAFARDFSLLNTRLRHPDEVIGVKFLLRALWAGLLRPSRARAA